MTVETMDERIRRAEVLVEALPFIRRFAGHTVVVKLGGAAIESGDTEPVLQDVVLLRFVGLRPVLVHGGGPEISAWQKRIGLETRFVNGLRVTDAQTMEIAKMVLTGKVGPDLVAGIHRLGGRAIGLTSGDTPKGQAQLYFRPHDVELVPEGAALAGVGPQVPTSPHKNVLMSQSKGLPSVSP